MNTAPNRSSRSRIPRRASCAASVILAAAAHAQYVADGDLNGLPIGPAPSCGEPAGAWQIPPTYPNCELLTTDFEVVESRTFVPGTPGHSLHVHCASAIQFEFASNLFLQSIVPAPGQVVRVAFDIGVPARAPAGVTIVVGGQHPGGFGVYFGTDRGPQLTWMGNGTIVAWMWDPIIGTVVPQVLVTGYPRDTWQSVRLDIHMDAQTFDLALALPAQPLSTVATGVRFRSPEPQSLVDRFTAAHFPTTPGFPPAVESYIDNLTVSVVDACYADCNLDGVLTVADFGCFQTEFVSGDPYADCNADGLLTVPDFGCFQTAFAVGCP